MRYITLHNGYPFPVLGLGTWKSKDEVAEQTIATALEIGYRAFDTAFIYGNEKAIGNALKKSDIPREEIYLTSKAWNTVSTRQETRDAFNKSCEDLGTDYLDLYLIHWPGDYHRNSAVWSVMEELYHEGRIKAIGVSNFNVHHINQLMKDHEVKPMVNQVECHVQLQNNFLYEFCMGHDIFLQAYSPLMSSEFEKITKNEQLAEIGKPYNKTAAQVALKWLLSRDIIALPKSSNKDRLKQNYELFDFELTNEDMFEIRKMNKGKRIFPEPDNADFGFTNW